MTSPERYHLTLSTAGRPAMHGWWGKRATAERKFASRKEERGDVPGARIVLVDEESGEALASWPTEA